MKTSATLTLFVAIAFAPLCRSHSESVPGSTLPKLTGIMNVQDRPSVILEVPAPLSWQRGEPTWSVLSAGERQQDLEVRAINVEKRSADITFEGVNLALKLAVTNKDWTSKNEIYLTNTPLDIVFRLYGEFSQRSILRHPSLPNTRVTFCGTATHPAAAAQIFAQTLTNCGVAIVPDGQKFLLAVPSAMVASAKPAGFRAPPSGATSTIILGGEIDWIAAKPYHVATIYAELIGRRMDFSASFPPMEDFKFRTQSPLTKEDAIYVIDLLFAWRGVKIVPVDDKLARCVPLK